MMRYVRGAAVILTLVLCSFVVVLLIHSKAMTTRYHHVPILSEENFTGAFHWWLIGAPFYLWVVFAPGKYFLNEDDDDTSA